MFTYKAILEKVIDGDTIDVTIDLGFEIYARKRLRLAGINAPETRTLEGIAAKEFLQAYLLPGETLSISTRKGPDLYNRWIAVVWAGDTEINNLMLEKGMAVPSLYK